MIRNSLVTIAIFVLGLNALTTNFLLCKIGKNNQTQYEYEKIDKEIVDAILRLQDRMINIEFISISSLLKTNQLIYETTGQQFLLQYNGTE